MKIDLKDLKKAISWIEANTVQEHMSFYLGDNKLIISTMDKYEAMIEITLYESSTLMPVIKKTERL